MPWDPELFTAPALARVFERHRRERLVLIPFYLGLMTGELDAIVESFDGEPVAHHPIRGRISGAAAFTRYARDTSRWLAERDVMVEDVGFTVTPTRRVEEVVLHLDVADGRVALPVAVAADRLRDAGIVELRIYFSAALLTGMPAVRLPMLPADPAVQAPEELRDRVLALGGVGLDPCAITEDGHRCALEYDRIVAGHAVMQHVAGLAVSDRGSVRIYDDGPGAARARAEPAASTLGA